MSASQVKQAVDSPIYFQNTKEVPQPVGLRLFGNLPSWLRGTIYSIAPGTFDLGQGTVGHWMDGFGLISKFEIGENSIKFSSKYLQSTAYKKALEANKPIVPGYGTPPGDDTSRSFFSKLMLAFTPNDMTDNNIGRIVQLGSKLYVLADLTYFQEIDPLTLDTVQTLHSNTTLGLNVFSSDVLQDKNGDKYIIGTCLYPTMYYTVKKMPAGKDDSTLLEEKFQDVGSIPSRWSFGSTGTRSCFAVSQNYIIFVEVPLVLNALTLAATYVKGYTMTDWFDWLPDDSNRFYIMHKDTGEVIDTEIVAEKAFFIYSLINAYEEDNKIIFDCFIATNVALFETFMMRNLRSNKTPSDCQPGVYHRYVIPVIKDIYKVPEQKSLIHNNSTTTTLTEGMAEAKRVGDKLVVSPEFVMKSDTGFDMGVINPTFAGRRNSFVYNSTTPPSALLNSSVSKGIAKVDLESRKILMWELPEGKRSVEPVFIPNPNSLDDEDDGVVITLSRNYFKSNGPDFMVFIDAKTMKDIARAEFNEDYPVAAWMRASFFRN